MNQGVEGILDLAQCTLRRPRGFTQSLINTIEACKGLAGSQEPPLLSRIAAAQEIRFADPHHLTDAIEVAAQVLGVDGLDPFLSQEERAQAKAALKKLSTLSQDSPEGRKARDLFQSTVDAWLESSLHLEQKRNYCPAYLGALTESGYFDHPDIFPHEEADLLNLTPAQLAIKEEVERELAALRKTCVALPPEITGQMKGSNRFSRDSSAGGLGRERG